MPDNPAMKILQIQSDSDDLVTSDDKNEILMGNILSSIQNNPITIYNQIDLDNSVTDESAIEPNKDISPVRASKELNELSKKEEEQKKP